MDGECANDTLSNVHDVEIILIGEMKAFCDQHRWPKGKPNANSERASVDIFNKDVFYQCFLDIQFILPKEKHLLL